MPDEPTHPPILTVAEVAHYLRVSETTVWRWCSCGKLPAFRIGRSWRVFRSDLSLLIQQPEHRINEMNSRDKQIEAL